MTAQRSTDPRVAEAHAKDWDSLVQQLQIQGLQRAGAERIGPCPRCGGDDRFGINTRKGVFQCRRCEAKGDQIALVQLVLGLDFLSALDWLVGPKPEISERERARLEEMYRRNRERKAREDEAFRRKAIADARAIWRASVPAEDTPVRDYLALRGITRDLLPKMPACLRYHPDLAYMVRLGPDGYFCIHQGPAMVAAIQSPSGQATAVHRTWFDLNAPLGKITIEHPETHKPEARKKTWGSKKGGAIRLTGHEAEILVMGEGIETTLSAMVSGKFAGAMFWAGVDLGNMAGSRVMGKGQKYAGIPDLEDADAFVPPAHVKRLIYVMDGDSDPRETRAKLTAGLRRAMICRPGLRGQIARVPNGFDLNDVLLGRHLQGAAA